MFIQQAFLYGIILIPLVINQAQADDSGQHCRIMVLGDSLSAAHGIAREDGWVALLNNKLQRQHIACSVINASVSGETSQGGRQRLDHLLQRHQPSIIILELGANNGLRALPVDSMKADLAAIIDKAQHHHVRVLLVGMRMPPNYGAWYTQAFANSYRQLAEQYQLPFLPFFLEGVATKRSWLQDDGLHPTAEAQPRLLQNVWQHLSNMLAEDV